jgi:HAMP domain-containing protein
MTLRTRILLGYGYLIGLLLLSVSVAAINSQRVAGNAKQILDRNIQSLGQAIEMLAQLERQDSETLLGLLQPASGTRLEDADHAFEVALAAADETSQASIDDEDRNVLTILREEFEEYRKVRGDLLSRVYDDPMAAAEDYKATAQKAFMTLKGEVKGYVTQKTEALELANDAASRSAIEGAVLLGVLVTIALLSLGFLSRSLQRDVLGRLTEVGHVTEAIAAGDRRRRVRDFYQDELGLVARQLNAALDRQHELESQMQGRLLEQRRVLVGLLNQWPTPAAMIGIDGELVASTLTVDDEAELHRLTPRVRMAAKVLMTRRFVKAEELAADIKASDGKRVVQIRALASGDNQIAGWLASFVRPRTRAPEPSGIFPIAPETSDVFPIAPDTSGLRPVLREPGGLAPVSSEPSGLRPVIHGVSGPRPLARAGSGPLTRSSPTLPPIAQPSEPEAEPLPLTITQRVTPREPPALTPPPEDPAIGQHEPAPDPPAPQFTAPETTKPGPVESTTPVTAPVITPPHAAPVATQFAPPPLVPRPSTAPPPTAADPPATGPDLLPNPSDQHSPGQRERK